MLEPMMLFKCIFPHHEYTKDIYRDKVQSLNQKIENIKKR